MVCRWSQMRTIRLPPSRAVMNHLRTFDKNRLSIKIPPYGIAIDVQAANQPIGVPVVYPNLKVLELRLINKFLNNFSKQCWPTENHVGIHFNQKIELVISILKVSKQRRVRLLIGEIMNHVLHVILISLRLHRSTSRLKFILDRM